MPAIRQYTDGPYNGGNQPSRAYRGSRKRLAKLRWRDNVPFGLWVLFLILILMFFVAFPWLITHDVTR